MMRRQQDLQIYGVGCLLTSYSKTVAAIAREVTRHNVSYTGKMHLEPPNAWQRLPRRAFSRASTWEVSDRGIAGVLGCEVRPTYFTENVPICPYARRR